MDSALSEIAARRELLDALPAVEERERLRCEAGLSLIGAAKAIGVSRTWLSRFEKGLGVRLSDERLVALVGLYDACRGREVA
jgi:predicted transcriptional regulator